MFGKSALVIDGSYYTFRAAEPEFLFPRLLILSSAG